MVQCDLESWVPNFLQSYHLDESWSTRAHWSSFLLSWPVEVKHLQYRLRAPNLIQGVLFDLSCYKCTICFPMLIFYVYIPQWMSKSKKKLQRMTLGKNIALQIPPSIEPMHKVPSTVLWHWKVFSLLIITSSSNSAIEGITTPIPDNI